MLSGDKMSISAKDVMKLRKQTGAGMMDCKKALQENDGDMESAIDFLRKKGLKTAEKRAGREVNEGKVVFCIADDGKSGSLLEFNSETDFVSGTPEFKQFAKDAGLRALENKPADIEALYACKAVSDTSIQLNDQLNVMTAKLGEKMGVRRFAVMTLPAERAGKVHSYIHLGDKHGVMVAVSCDKDATASTPEFTELANDLCLQIVAYNPVAVDRDGIDAGNVERELDVYRDMARNEGKPEQIIDKIAQGKLNKYYSEVTLLGQGFVKEDKMSVQDHIKAVSKTLDDKIVVEGFEAYTIGS
jgi:elongation factor Ts